eukprot:TRINITY_DN2307_c0_g1_i2.p1 TRINITY_DN2307_c0_g1~~TRINITY_DN2307_c0_g1_i2.p1  ORF type:complete len:339 (+),score=73.85 TRINITY_DN2307_c0_g1_i2:431-1447(+)
MTHLIVAEIEGNDKVALMYAHWDKQPPLDGLWREGLGPRSPVVEGDLLYGRGSADDGYGTYAAVLTIKACQKMKLGHPKIIMVLEGCEESGKNDFEYYLKKLVKTKLRKIDYVFCLDSGAASVDRLWMTTSLRGIVAFNLTVRVLQDPVHSGDAGGIVPESFRICRILLDRLCSKGKLIDDLYTKIPESRLEETKKLCEFAKGQVYQYYPFLPGVRPEHEDPTELLLRRTWRPSLAVTGAEGLPPIEHAGNVLRASTTLRLSVRIPPLVDARQVAAKVVELLTRDPPYSAVVEAECVDASDGWNATEFTPEFKGEINRISKVCFDGSCRIFLEMSTVP